MLTIEEAHNVVNSFIRQFSRHDDMPTAVQGLEIAKEALEKQIQKAPEKRIDYSTNTDLSKNETPVTEYYCSNCNKRIYVSENFCTQCGQKIDWSNEDD